MQRRGRTPSEPRAVVAAATRIRLDDKRLAKKQVARRQAWQEDAWEFFDLFGFVKQALWLLGNAIAKTRLYIAIENPNDPDGEPLPITDEQSGVPEAVRTQALAELDRLRGPLGGLSEILRELDMNLEVAGEGYLIGYGARDAVLDPTGALVAEAQDESWSVKSTSEVTFTSGGEMRVLDEPGQTRGRVLDDTLDTAIRFWLPHPRWSNTPDSAMRGELEDLETLLILSRQRRAEGKSRLPSGLLLLDSNITVHSPVITEQGNGRNSSTGDVVLDAISDAISDAIEDESSAAGLAPVAMRVTVPPNSRVADMVAKVDLSRTSDSYLDTRIDKIVESVARGLNMPVESVMGHQQTTFANAEQIDEDKFYDHIEPRLVLIVDLLTIAFLRPQLVAPDEFDTPAPPEFVEWADRLFVWYDPAALLSKPDTGANADLAHEKLTISDSAYRAAKGFGDDDAPDPLELLIRSGLRRGILTADLTKALLDLLGVSIDVQPMPKAVAEPVETEAAARRQPQYEAIAALLTAAAHAEPEAVASPPTHIALPPSRALVRAVDDNPGRKLMDIDRELRTRLLIAADAAMTRALERAGNRAKQKLPEARALVRNVSSVQVLRTLSPSIVAAGGVSDDELLAGAFDEIEKQFMAWGAKAQSEALDLASTLGTGMNIERRAALQLRQAEDLQEGWAWMQEQLTTLARARMYDPAAAAATLIGEFDPSLSVPPGLVRQAVTRAGGTIGVQTTNEKDAWVALADNGARPAGGIGTGELIREGLAGSGVGFEGYRWVYGPAQRQAPYEPHVDLDGTIVGNFDEAVLSNDATWPSFGFYFPGDHAGCLCDIEPIVIEGGAGTTSEAPLPEVETTFPGGLSQRDTETWMQDRYGTRRDGSLRSMHMSGLGVTQANEMAKTFDELMRAYPNTADRLTAVGASADVTRTVNTMGLGRMRQISPRAYADTARETGHIRVSGKFRTAKALEQLDRDVATGYHPPGTASLASVVRHEFGHQLYFEAQDRARLLGKSWDLESEIDTVMARHVGVHPREAGYFGARYVEVKAQIGRYALTNADELMAEAFAYVTSSDTPSALARELVAVLVRWAEPT